MAYLSVENVCIVFIVFVDDGDGDPEQYQNFKIKYNRLFNISYILLKPAFEYSECLPS